MEYWQTLGEYDAETQAFSAFVGTGGSSPWTPPKDGTITAIRFIVNAQAATSLTRGVWIRLSCVIWAPNTISFFVAGNGLKTVPDAFVPVLDFPCSLPVKTTNPITLEGRCLEATHVTNSVLVQAKIVG